MITHYIVPVQYAHRTRHAIVSVDDARGQCTASTVADMRPVHSYQERGTSDATILRVARHPSVATFATVEEAADSRGLDEQAMRAAVSNGLGISPFAQERL